MPKPTPSRKARDLLSPFRGRLSPPVGRLNFVSQEYNNVPAWNVRDRDHSHRGCYRSLAFPPRAVRLVGPRRRRLPLARVARPDGRLAEVAGRSVTAGRSPGVDLPQRLVQYDPD